MKFNLILNTSKYTAGNLKYEVQVELEVPSLRVTRAGVTVTASASLSLTRRSAAVPLAVIVVPLAVPLPVLDFKLDTQPELTGTLEAGTQAGRLAAEPHQEGHTDIACPQQNILCGLLAAYDVLLWTCYVQIEKSPRHAMSLA